MKKVILMLIMLLFGIQVNAAVNDSEVRIEWIPNVYYNYEKDGLIYWGQLGYIYANDTISYCYEIEKTITTNIYSSSNRMIDFTSKVILSSYFGYGYKNNNRLEHYMATQQIIWEDRGINVYFTTSNKGEGNVIDVSAYKNQILKYVNNYKTFPSLNGLFKFDVGTSNIITDKSYSLDDFTVYNTSDNIVTINSKSELSIIANKEGDYYFDLNTKYDSRHENKKYTASNSQTIIQIGTINNLSKRYPYYVDGGSININMYDAITNSIENTGLSTFLGNVFKLYDSNNKLIDTYETMEDGKLHIKDLNIGMYTLEHIVVSDGYTKTTNIYNIEIKKDNINYNLDIYLQPKKITLNIDKTYGNPKLGTIFYDDNVVFDVINSKGEVISKITTDEFGRCDIELFYDDYIIRQSTTNNVDILESDYEIKKSDFNKNHNYNIFTPIYKTKIKVYLYESGTTIPITNHKIYVDSDEYVTSDEGYIVTDYKSIGEYTIKREKSLLYYDIDDISVVINENSNMYLEDNEVYLDVIIYSEKIPVKKEIEEEKKDIEEKSVEIKKVTDIEEHIIEEKIIEEINNEEKLDILKEDTAIKEEVVIVENNIRKLPNLGIYDCNILYMILFIVRFKNDKKNNL